MFSRFDRERLHPRLRARQLIPQLLVGRLVLCNLCCVLIVQRFQSRLVLSDSCMLLGLELLRSVLSSLQLSLQLCTSSLKPVSCFLSQCKLAAQVWVALP